ncbi:MAG: hypothetical protein F7B95_04420 [Desulfurococcales archaeon]|nr:hypothetical protein [Desulfurococcales archaeon]
MVRYRCRHDIVADILHALREHGALRLSHISLKANLPLDRAKALLEDLAGAGLIVWNPVSQRYSITPRGHEWLSLYTMLNEIYKPESTSV